jgi:hypothetical protein
MDTTQGYETLDEVCVNGEGQVLIKDETAQIKTDAEGNQVAYSVNPDASYDAATGLVYTPEGTQPLPEIDVYEMDSTVDVVDPATGSAVVDEIAALDEALDQGLSENAIVLTGQEVKDESGKIYILVDPETQPYHIQLADPESMEVTELN